MNVAGFWAELKRRRVVRVALVYLAAAFAVLQAADILVPALHLPAWMVTFVAVLLALGFPIALVLGWALELTPDGVRVTPSAAASGDPAPSLLGRGTLVAAALLVAVGGGLGAGWRLLEIFHHLGDQDGVRELVRRIDALPGGPAILAVEIYHRGGALNFNPADTPNFSARLREAGVDPASFPVVPRLGVTPLEQPPEEP